MVKNLEFLKYSNNNIKFEWGRDFEYLRTRDLNELYVFVEDCSSRITELNIVDIERNFGGAFLNVMFGRLRNLKKLELHSCQSHWSLVTMVKRNNPDMEVIEHQ